MSSETQSSAFSRYFDSLSERAPKPAEEVIAQIKIDLQEVNDRIVELTEKVRPLKRQYAEMAGTAQTLGNTPLLRKLYKDLEKAKKDLEDLQGLRNLYLRQLLNLDILPLKMDHGENE